MYTLSFCICLHNKEEDLRIYAQNRRENNPQASAKTYILLIVSYYCRVLYVARVTEGGRYEYRVSIHHTYIHTPSFFLIK